MSTKIRICIRTAIWIILQCITFMAYAQNIGGACITSLTYTTSDASSYIVQKVYANGNMTKDRNKGISNITYNTMNLPSRIEFENGSRATYLYSADGTKLQVKYETSYAGLLASGPPSGSASTAIAQTHTIDYVGNKIYKDGVLSRILIEGGYVDYSGETPIYHTYLTDHQGNVRVVVDENAAVKQVNHYYPYGALFAESTNGDVQPYKYNGKALDRMHGLDWYDHGARHNDAAIGRWHVMDPFCEKYYDVSPYAYCAGDPVNAVDIDGRKIVDANGNLMLFIDKNGMIHYTKFANNDTHTLTNSLSLSTTGKTMLNKMIKSDINVHFHISDEVEMSDKTITYGTTIQGNMNINDNYGKTDDGKNIRESTITIYRGSIKEGIKQGSGLKHEGLI